MPGIPESALDEDKARSFLERTRWAKDRFCPHCGSVESYSLTPRKEGTKTRKGLYKCKACRKQFTVTVGTIFEGSHIPLHKWMMAVHLMTSSKKGISAHQLHRMLGITYKSAWFMAHRIRYSMTQEPMAKKLRGIVEVDETYISGTSKSQPRYIGNPPRKPIALALVARNGQMRSFRIKASTSEELKGAIRRNVDKRSRIITDEWQAYKGIGKEFHGGHQTTNHSKKEYVRGDVYSNSAESYFALLKRGIHGTFHFITEKHLDRYCAEFAFRWNNKEVTDGERAVEALRGAEGKRLMYRALPGMGA
ncbi:MAG: IS1595 family transposase [Patescibacteria group bacterium]|nr:IS1595 family transposase [Patescibacteria group bacterium]